MTRRYWPILIFCTALTLPASLWAHHSWSGDYFLDKTVTVKGKIAQFEYQNPHSVLHFEVTNDQGVTETWVGEWAGAGKLNNEGVSKGKLKPGDELTIFGNPGRAPDEHRLHILGIRRTDGFKWGKLQ